MRAELLRIRDVAKVDLVGVQDEKIYLEFSTQQIAALGLDPNALVQTLQAQNAVTPAARSTPVRNASPSGSPANSPPRRASRR